MLHCIVLLLAGLMRLTASQIYPLISAASLSTAPQGFGAGTSTCDQTSTCGWANSSDHVMAWAIQALPVRRLISAWTCGGTPWDTVLDIYINSPELCSQTGDSLTLVATKDNNDTACVDYPPNPLASSISFVAEASIEYLLVLRGATRDACGDANMFLTATIFADLPGAQTIVIPDSSLTTTPQDFGVGISTCDQKSACGWANSSDHIASWVLQATPVLRRITAQSCGGAAWDTSLDVFINTPELCSQTGDALGMVATNDDDSTACPGNLSASLVSFNAEADTEYRIVLHGFDPSACGDANLLISAWSSS
eukprot:CAMPEP_0119109452 /NCGR_PEP_ID=MMETSP1180-20130426/17917_1 /TAXON_ID=3052 ORGANISM="Chlamydomonas cf sp, Strain CCMP681" /NCGR_SAMPLE_ID=MMETSP1180 /ASSEMBLY_ACC=CAM_ASM_000741 /LENGTH=309 /DNA_ID=CAMNT_0007095209 /DNA_START=74 /DNA_END=1003 /DNA_ORIENTATION=-